MDDTNAALAQQLVPPTYIQQGLQSLRMRQNLLKHLLSHRKLPMEGWDDASITYVLQELALMDSNNFSGSAGGGEREGRVVCPLIQRRHYGFSHGIGRSGDVSAIQPKAAGSSLLYQLANALVLHAIQAAGITRAKKAVVLPMATGMSMALVLACLRNQRPGAKYVLWSRIDQKACLKAILAAGLHPVAVPLKRDKDEFHTDMDAMRAALADNGGPSACVAIVSTTSCFAPRGYDDTVALAQWAAKEDIPHVINHAYGLQASKLCHIVNESMRSGRVDAVVSSTDKNLLVPVGGALVYSQHPKTVEAVCATYAGRASASPIIDVFTTLLYLGESGLRQLLQDRKSRFEQLREALTGFAARHGMRVLHTPHNPISLAVELQPAVLPKDATFFGSMLFNRGVSGVRVVTPSAALKSIGPCDFQNYGAHTDGVVIPYFTVAAAIGMQEKEIGVLLKRLEKTWKEFMKKHRGAGAVEGSEAQAAGLLEEGGGGGGGGGAGGDGGVEDGGSRG